MKGLVITTFRYMYIYIFFNRCCKFNNFATGLRLKAGFLMDL